MMVERLLLRRTRQCLTPLVSSSSSTAVSSSLNARLQTPPSVLPASLRKPFLSKSLSTSPSSLQPQGTPVLFQQQQSREMESTKPFSEIPRNKTFLGFDFDLMKDPTAVAEYTTEVLSKLGPICRLKVGPGMPEMIFLTDPEDVEVALRAGDEDNYPRRFPMVEWKQARKELNSPMGLFLEEGEEWHKQRLPVSKFIMMPRKMAEYYEPFNKVTLDYIDLVRAQRQKDGLMLDVAGSLNKWSVESVSLFVLGKRMGCLGDQMPEDCKQLVDDLHEFISVTNDLLFGFPYHKLWRTKKWERLIKSLKTMLAFTKGHIDQKILEIEKQGEGDEEEHQAELGMDFLTYMIHSGKLSVSDVAVNAIDLLLAGVDTTSLTMAACLYSLGTCGEVQEKLRREVQDVVGKEELVTPQHIQNMPYLRDTIKETMRMYPIATNNSRVLTKDVVIRGYRIPADTIIVIPTIACGRDPTLFSDPLSFNPDRWDRKNEQFPNSFSSLPFGYGRRSCVGRRVAELEMHIQLAQIIRNFKVEYREDQPMKFYTKLFHGPARQLDLAFTDIS